MTDRFHSRTPVDHYEAALEGGCDTLIMLQLLRDAARSGREIGDLDAEISRAIDSLRRAIAELRLSDPTQRNAPVVGFVLDEGTENPLP